MKAMLVLALVAGGCATRPMPPAAYTEQESAQLRTIAAERQRILQSGSYRLCAGVAQTGMMTLAVENDAWVPLAQPVAASPGITSMCHEASENFSVELARLDERETDVRAHRAVREADEALAQDEHRRQVGAALGAALSQVGDSLSGRDRVHLHCVQTGPTTSVCN